MRGWLNLNTHRNAQTRSGGRVWGCNWGVTRLVYFWSMCCSGAGPNSWACASTRASRDVCPSSNEQIQVSDNQRGHLLTFCMSSTSLCSLRVCVCVFLCCLPLCITLFGRPKETTDLDCRGGENHQVLQSVIMWFALAITKANWVSLPQSSSSSEWMKKKKKGNGPVFLYGCLQ